MRAEDCERLQFLLDTVRREGEHLQQTTRRLFSDRLDGQWLSRLEDDPVLSERVDAYSARFGRVQDTIGDKLIPEFLRRLAEAPGVALDNLNRLERLGLVASVRDWVEARNLRNRLVHEYVRDPEEFIGALERSRELVPLLISTYNAINRFSRKRFAKPISGWPEMLPAESAFEPGKQT